MVAGILPEAQGIPAPSLTTTNGVPPSLVIRPFRRVGNIVSARQFTNNAFNHHHGIQAEERFGLGVDADGDDFVNELTNVEQEVTLWARVFGRLEWNDGANESYAYTEIDRTAEFGGDLSGRRWHRSQDKIGAAFVTNGISGDHGRHLELGGLGFILGDGGLRYDLEKTFETYYPAHVSRGISVALDYQHVTNPGYNQDRGPASVVSFRIHVEDAIPFGRLGV